MADLAQRRKELLDSMMREAVYEAAVAVLGEHGLKGLTMDRVAATAGMAKGSLYNHFRNKQELLEFVHVRAVGPMVQKLEEVVASDLGAVEKLRSISLLWRRYLGEHQAVFEFLINDHAVKGLLSKTEQTTRTMAIRHIAAIIRQGIEQGLFRPLDATAVAEMFVGAGIEMVEQELAAARPRPAQEAVEMLLQVFLYGLCTASCDRESIFGENASQSQKQKKQQ